jgi:hypothetical protein
MLNVEIGRVVHSHVYQYIAILLTVFPEVLFVIASCISCILGWRCAFVNSAELAQISFAEAASLVRPCVMISLWMNLL